MTDKRITIRPGNMPAPADRRALADKSREEFARRAQALWRQTGKVERRTVPFRCAVTGGHFRVVFDRPGPLEPYRVFAVEKITGPGAASAPVETTPPMELKDFDLSGWRCPYCSSGDFCRCDCGETVCQGRTKDQGNGVLQFHCHPGCGRWGWTVPYDKMHADGPQGRPGHAAPSRKALPGVNRPALPYDGTPRLDRPR